MKTLLLFIILFASIGVRGQTVDSLALKYSLLNDRIDNIQLNLNKAAKQYNVGVGLIAFGSMVAILSSTQLSHAKDIKTTQILFGSACVLTTAGFVVLFDSNKFILEASKH